MARNSQECKEIGVVALLRQGKPASAKVTFVFLKDNVELQRVDGQISADSAARTGKSATCKFTPPEVAKDKPKYRLNYYVIADGDEYRNADDIDVWPRKVKVQTVKEDDSGALAGVKFKTGSDDKAVTIKTTGDPATAEFVLGLGTEFDPSQLQAVAPWEFVGAPQKKDGALRDLKIKAKLNLVAEVLAPVIPGDKKIKQWVNLPTTNNGQDGKAEKVLFRVGIQGDAARQPADKVGGPGVFVFVKVEFAADGTLGIVPLKAPSYDPIPPGEKAPMVTGHFALDLLAAGAMARLPQTVFVYAFSGEALEGPVPVGLVTEAMLPK